MPWHRYLLRRCFSFLPEWKRKMTDLCHYFGLALSPSAIFLLCIDVDVYCHWLCCAAAGHVALAGFAHYRISVAGWLFSSNTSGPSHHASPALRLAGVATTALASGQPGQTRRSHRMIGEGKSGDLAIILSWCTIDAAIILPS